MFDSTGEGCDDLSLPGSRTPQKLHINSVTPGSGGTKGGTQVKLDTNRFNLNGAELVFDGKVVKNAEFRVGQVGRVESVCGN